MCLALIIPIFPSEPSAASPPPHLECILGNRRLAVIPKNLPGGGGGHREGDVIHT